MAGKRKSYEDKFDELNEIVDSFEAGELSLGDSMKHYEKGIKLCNDLFKELNGIQGKIVKLNEGDDKDE